MAEPGSLQISIFQSQQNVEGLQDHTMFHDHLIIPGCANLWIKTSAFSKG